MRSSETTDQAKDGGKKSFEVPSAREKVKETEEPKAKGEYLLCQSLVILSVHLYLSIT